MNYSKLILIFLLIASIIFIIHVNGQEAPVKNDEFDEHDNKINSKKVLRKENDKDTDESNIINKPSENKIEYQNNEELVITEIPTIFENENENKSENEGENVNEFEMQTIYEIEDDNDNKNENNENNNNDNDNENENEVGKNVTEVEVIMDETIILTKSSDMKDFFKTNEKMVIGCFETIGNEDYLNFKNISNSMIESPSFATENYFNGEVLKFIYINDNKCRHTIKRFTGISIFKNDVVYCINKRCYEYNPKDLIDFNKFEEFMESKNMPLVTSYDPKEKDTYRQWKIPMIIYLNNDEEKAKKNVKTFISDIAKEYRKEFFFFVTNENDFDIDMADEPTDNNVFIYAPHFQTLYSIQEILDPEDVIDKVSIEFFIKQYKMNLLTPKMVIQDFEELWDYEDFVVNSIPKYYYPNVLNPLRDSLVMFYKEDCPYSQELLKTFVKLGKKYVNSRTEFSVVKYEAEEQKIPKMSLWRKLEGYPTIVLFKASPYTREKKEFFVYPDNAGRSAVSINKWVQLHSFYKPEASFTLEDYKEQEKLEKDSDEIEDNEEEEERITKYLQDPDLIFTRYGYGKEMEEGIEEDEDEENEGGGDFYFDNINTKKEIPMTGTYYELTSTTYAVKTSTYTPPPSLYDDDEEENKKEEEDSSEE